MNVRVKWMSVPSQTPVPPPPPAQLYTKQWAFTEQQKTNRFIKTVWVFLFPIGSMNKREINELVNNICVLHEWINVAMRHGYEWFDVCMRRMRRKQEKKYQLVSMNWVYKNMTRCVMFGFCECILLLWFYYQPVS